MHNCANINFISIHWKLEDNQMQITDIKEMHSMLGTFKQNFMGGSSQIKKSLVFAVERNCKQNTLLLEKYNTKINLTNVNPLTLKFKGETLRQLHLERLIRGQWYLEKMH